MTSALVLAALTARCARSSVLKGRDTDPSPASSPAGETWMETLGIRRWFSGMNAAAPMTGIAAIRQTTIFSTRRVMCPPAPISSWLFRETVDVFHELPLSRGRIALGKRQVLLQLSHQRLPCPHVQIVRKSVV